MLGVKVAQAMLSGVEAASSTFRLCFLGCVAQIGYSQISMKWWRRVSYHWKKYPLVRRDDLGSEIVKGKELLRILVSRGVSAVVYSSGYVT
ncbi:MAG: hypothetical protein H6774_00340 [Pseudomonadales bacterium]|nr:hypothetical protein [Pseudomonadales bacterium]